VSEPVSAGKMSSSLCFEHEARINRLKIEKTIKNFFLLNNRLIYKDINTNV